MCSEALDQFKNKNSTEFWLEEGKLYECYHSLQRINNGGEIALIRTNKEPLVKRGLYCRQKAALKNLLNLGPRGPKASGDEETRCISLVSQRRNTLVLEKLKRP